MGALSLFGLLAVTAMLVAYALEERSRWFILAFAGACALSSIYAFLQGSGRSGWSSDLGRCCIAALDNQAAITSPLLFRQSAKPFSAL